MLLSPDAADRTRTRFSLTGEDEESDSDEEDDHTPRGMTLWRRDENSTNRQSISISQSDPLWKSLRNAYGLSDSVKNNKRMILQSDEVDEDVTTKAAI